MFQPQLLQGAVRCLGYKHRPITLGLESTHFNHEHDVPTCRCGEMSVSFPGYAANKIWGRSRWSCLPTLRSPFGQNRYIITQSSLPTSPPHLRFSSTSFLPTYSTSLLRHLGVLPCGIRYACIPPFLLPLGRGQPRSHGTLCSWCVTLPNSSTTPLTIA
jgi:hypothetical protein